LVGKRPGHPLTPASWAALLALLAFATFGSSLRGSADPLASDPGEPDRMAALEGLVGDWYVLIHYRDRVAENPEQILWQDEIWRIERVGSGLRWSVYPHVEFRDARARTEELGQARHARTLGAWTPNEAQLEEVRRGLELDGDGSRSKQLRGSIAQGFRSAGELHSASSSMIGYHESWRIDAPQGHWRFERVDAMGSGRTTALSGTTRLSTREVLAAGLELRGNYERDGELHGDFRMLRMGTHGASRAPASR
jgi:hypothetical protein